MLPESDVEDCWILDIPIKLVAADAGFLPFGPLTFFADIVSDGGIV